jgi:hypothetical protein
MAHGSNRAGAQPRSHFRQAGGSIIKFRHPYFAGMIDTPDGTAIDEIDISSCCKLEGRFFEATQNQDSAKQTVLIDGSTVTITNKMLNGTITIPAVPTTGDIATGDFIAGCQLIRSVGDSVGGVITKTDFVGGKAKTKVYYGIAVKTCPDDVSEGNEVAVYNIQLLYSGWVEAESIDSDLNVKAIWAVGSKEGIKGIYSPYGIQNASGDKGTSTRPLEGTDLAPVNGTSVADKYSDSTDNTDEIKDVQSKWKSIVDVKSVLDGSNAKDEGESAKGTNPTAPSES